MPPPAASPNDSPTRVAPTAFIARKALPPDDSVRASRALALGGTLALIVLGLLWELWLAPTGSGTLAIKVLPLVPLLPGLARYRMWSYRALSLLVWLYVTEGLVRATSEGGLAQALAAAEVALALLVFAACAWHVRWRLARAAWEES